MASQWRVGSKYRSASCWPDHKHSDASQNWQMKSISNHTNSSLVWSLSRTVEESLVIHSWRVFALSVLLSSLLLSSPLAQEESSPASGSNPYAGNPAAIALGQVIFEAQCAAECHPKATGWKGGKYPNLFDCEWLHGGSDEEIFQTITRGVPQTEKLGWEGKLPEESIWRVIAYLRSASQCEDDKTALLSAH